MPLFLPLPTYVNTLDLSDAITLEALCQLAGVKCKATGEWIKRKVKIHVLAQSKLSVLAQPSDMGGVIITMPGQRLEQKSARLALAVMAYSIFDPVARESIRNQHWTLIAPPRGRSKVPQALSNAQRQRKFRSKST